MLLILNEKFEISKFINSIAIDSFGYMAVGCFAVSGNFPDNPYTIALYNANNRAYLNQLATSYQPYVTVVDAYGRFVSISPRAIYIYY